MNAFKSPVCHRSLHCLYSYSANPKPGLGNTQIISSIHSFIQDIYIAPPQVHFYSKALQITTLILCQS